MWNKLPIVGWFIAAIAAMSLSVPFYIAWTWNHIGEKFFYFLPEAYHRISFFEIFFLFITLGIVKWIIGCLTPRFMYVNNSNDNDNS